jgi:hypothetical protein
MAASADVVMTFLNDLSDIVRPKADEVFKGVNLILAWIIQIVISNQQSLSIHSMF